MAPLEQFAIPLSHISGITKAGKHVWWNVREPDAMAFFKGCIAGDEITYLQLDTESGRPVCRWARDIGSVGLNAQTAQAEA